jgi:hypothetical protein
MTEHKKTDDFKCKSEGVSPANDFYIFEKNKNCYEGKECDVFLCRMDEAACIMQCKGTYPIQNTVKLPTLVNKID